MDQGRGRPGPGVFDTGRHPLSVRSGEREGEEGVDDWGVTRGAGREEEGERGRVGGGGGDSGPTSLRGGRGRRGVTV